MKMFIVPQIMDHDAPNAQNSPHLQHIVSLAYLYAYCIMG